MADRTTTDPASPLAPGASQITDPHEFLKIPAEQLDDIFRRASVGNLPEGQGEGIAIVAPGTAISDDIANFVHIFQWKGKVFERDANNASHGWLKNRILLLGSKAVVADVSKGTSWFDGKECIVLDYSHTSIVAQWVRDEIREVSPGVFLGLVYWGKEKEKAHRLIHFALKF
ncbi:MAG TPA: hypothetical protein VGM82_11955 [Gemmatimonadaceae bacterium]|jgi:hypothetical protein